DRHRPAPPPRRHQPAAARPADGTDLRGDGGTEPGALPPPLCLRVDHLRRAGARAARHRHDGGDADGRHRPLRHRHRQPLLHPGWAVLPRGRGAARAGARQPRLAAGGGGDRPRPLHRAAGRGDQRAAHYQTARDADPRHHRHGAGLYRHLPGADRRAGGGRLPQALGADRQRHRLRHRRAADRLPRGGGAGLVHAGPHRLRHQPGADRHQCAGRGLRRAADGAHRLPLLRADRRAGEHRRHPALRPDQCGEIGLRRLLPAAGRADRGAGRHQPGRRPRQRAGHRAGAGGADAALLRPADHALQQFPGGPDLGRLPAALHRAGRLAQPDPL
ncbi:MAG: Ribose ABC transport system, permease protein RbsC, partial [uncultured Craurococcus sp.]